MQLICKFFTYTSISSNLMGFFCYRSHLSLILAMHLFLIAFHCVTLFLIHVPLTITLTFASNDSILASCFSMFVHMRLWFQSYSYIHISKHRILSKHCVYQLFISLFTIILRGFQFENSSVVLLKNINWKLVFPFVCPLDLYILMTKIKWGLFVTFLSCSTILLKGQWTSSIFPSD